MSAAPPSEPGLRRTLNVWQAVGLSVALMAPSMAANINPQGTAQTVGRAVPLAFLLSAIGVLLVAYVFVRLCQHFNSSGSVYAFVGATLGPRTGVVSGWGLMGTYMCYGVTTSSVVGLFATSFLEETHVWDNPPDWAPWIFTAAALLLAWVLVAAPVKRGTNILLSVEGITVVLILIVSAVVLVRLLANNAPQHQHFTLSVFSVPAGTGTSALFLGVVFGFLSFAGFEAAATLGEEAAHPRRDIPRAILGTAVFGGVYFVVVTAIEVMGFGTNAAGVAKFASSSSLIGDLGSSYVGSWVGDAITLGAMVSAFGCVLACTVGSARLLFALSRDGFGEKGPGKVSRLGTPAAAGTAVAVFMGLIIILCAVAFSAQAEDTFLWFGTIGTLIILVAYLLTTVGAIDLLFIKRKMAVPQWQIVIPLLAIVLLGYTVYRNVWPYPASNTPAFWFPVAAGGWLVLGIVGVLALPGPAGRIGAKLTEMSHIADAEGGPDGPVDVLAVETAQPVFAATQAVTTVAPVGGADGGLETEARGAVAVAVADEVVDTTTQTEVADTETTTEVTQTETVKVEAVQVEAVEAEAVEAESVEAESAEAAATEATGSVAAESVAAESVTAESVLTEEVVKTEVVETVTTEVTETVTEVETAETAVSEQAEVESAAEADTTAVEAKTEADPAV